MCAVLSAREAGARTLVLEKAPEAWRGGTVLHGRRPSLSRTPKRLSLRWRPPSITSARRWSILGIESSYQARFDTGERVRGSDNRLQSIVRRSREHMERENAEGVYKVMGQASTSQRSTAIF
jgi:hypothetical protein